MRKIVLISCASKKLKNKAKAEDLYVSPLFKLNLSYARSLKPDKIFILSAKYGLVGLKDMIEPYDLTLNNLIAAKIKDWAERVIGQLKKMVELEDDEVTFLAGNKYRKYLIYKIKHYQVPLRGLGIGRQLQFLKNKTK